MPAKATHAHLPEGLAHELAIISLLMARWTAHNHPPRSRAQAGVIGTSGTGIDEGIQHPICRIRARQHSQHGILIHTGTYRGGQHITNWDLIVNALDPQGVSAETHFIAIGVAILPRCNFRPIRKKGRLPGTHRWPATKVSITNTDSEQVFTRTAGFQDELQVVVERGSTFYLLGRALQVGRADTPKFVGAHHNGGHTSEIGGGIGAVLRQYGLTA